MYFYEPDVFLMDEKKCCILWKVCFLIKKTCYWFKVAQYLSEHDIAHNVFITRGSPLDDHNDLINYSAIKIFIWARHSIFGNKHPTDFCMAVCELGRHHLQSHFFSIHPNLLSCQNILKMFFFQRLKISFWLSNQIFCIDKLTPSTKNQTANLIANGASLYSTSSLTIQLAKCWYTPRKSMKILLKKRSWKLKLKLVKKCFKQWKKI